MILCATLHGITARAARINASPAPPGGPTLAMTGLAPAAERETRVRVQAALSSSGEPIARPTQVTCDATTIDTTAIDLAVALAIAGTDGPARIGAFAELSLSGEVRAVRGALPAVEALRGHAEVILVAPDNVAEAALVEGARVVAVRHLRDALRVARGDMEAGEPAIRRTHAPATAHPDLSDVAPAPRVRRALEVAVAGGHHFLLVGPPGAGKTMLARRVPGLLPPMTQEETLEVTRIHSVAGLNIGGGLVAARPFRAPHHSTTQERIPYTEHAALDGGTVQGCRRGVLL